MQPDTLDRDFRTYQQHRDPAALAAVFDAAAPRLLLVAMHLCRDAATAEDLVQTVFLQALRDVDRFDPRRPVLPWLLGMLEHRASDLRRSAHVRREQVVAAPSAASENTPERAAAASEVRERVAEALQGMPHDYRDVLTLRLVHGLSAVDIAHAHGLPPATVRTRLRRGLELLRGALPRGFATRGLLALLAAELVTARDGMAAVRAKVLAAAAAGAGVTFAFGWWLAVAATLVLATGGWLWLAPSAAVVLPPGADAPALAVASVADGEDHAHDVAARDRELAVSRSPVADPRMTTVRGRIVDAATSAAMGGVAAKVTTYPWEGVDDPSWRDPEPAITAADGTFAVPFVPSRNRGVELAVAVPGYVTEWLSWEPLREGVDVDAGDVQMRAGTPVQLRLLCDGQPLGGVETYASPAPDGKQPSNVNGHGASDADGFVDLGTCEPGPWWHDVRTAHLGNEARFDVPLQREPFVVRVELSEPPRALSISGVLVDTSGAPVAGVELGMRMPGSGYLTATTRSDGRFLWGQKVMPLASVRERIELFGDRRDLQWVVDGGEVVWGTHDLQLVVRRRAPATLRLEVFDASTQQPVEEFGATCKAEIGSCSAERRRVAIEHQAGGAATFTLAPGAYFASVFPDEPFAESAEIPVQIVEGRTTTLRVPLRPPTQLTVDVVDASTGAPLESIELALTKAVLVENSRDIPPAWYQQFREHPEMTGTGGKLAVIVLARGISDRRGRVCLCAPADVPRLVLVAGGPRCAPSETHDVVLPSKGAQTTIRVTPAAIVRGVVTPRAFVERFGPEPRELAEAAAKSRIEWTNPEEIARNYPFVVLRPLGASPPRRCVTHIAADGKWMLGGLPAGRYAIHVSLDGGTDFGPFATVDVDPGRDTPALTIDVAALVPARGTVRFFVDGAPAVGDGGLARIVDGGVDRQTFPLAPDGTATTPWLVPGTYVPFVVGGGLEQVFGTDRLVVPVGSTANIDATFALQRRTVTIHVVEKSGEPARDVFVWIDAIDPIGLGRCSWLPRRTDAEGRLVLIAAPPGRLRLRAFAGDQDLRDSNVEPALLLGEVAAGANAATFRLPR